MPPLDVFYPYRLQVIALYSHPSPDRSSLSLVKKRKMTGIKPSLG